MSEVSYWKISKTNFVSEIQFGQEIKVLGFPNTSLVGL